MPLKTLFLLLPLALLPSFHGTQDSAPASKPLGRVGVVNMMRLLSESKLAQDGLRQHEEWIKISQREIDAAEKAWKKLDEDQQLLARGSVEFQQNKDRLELEKLKFDQLVRRLEKERQERFIETMKRNYDGVVREVQNYAKSHGFDLILQLDATALRAKSEDELLSRILWKNVIHADDSLDITSDVLKILATQ